MCCNISATCGQLSVVNIIVLNDIATIVYRSIHFSKQTYSTCVVVFVSNGNLLNYFCPNRQIEVVIKTI